MVDVSSMYAQLVEKLGVKGAKAEMARRRGFVKSPGLANSTKKTRKRVSLEGVKARLDKL